MRKGIMKRIMIAALPLVINEVREYMKNRKKVKRIQQVNTVK
ncbi:hypothetical protein [Peribacillus cavernae]|nr:hypothetical protein [Peribacillus cavernae]MDQ0217324.1 hypothetical protein [Peribacillus cavernae]